MKLQTGNLNWKNFVQRTLLFLFLFVLIRYMVDVVEDAQPSLLRILRLSLVRYLVFAMILGLLDSDTWMKHESKATQPPPLQFANFSKAFLHYCGVAVVVALVCGAILLVFFLIQWGVNQLTGKSEAPVFPNGWVYLLVIISIGICFAAFDALRNWIQLHKQSKHV